ncbi:hypothetical protein [Caldivirga sp. UBA161]|uniref:hypothetical protein n=1 Tax=Caldivirga sp. UBA161 TaxID=1915569 RepID=UPI0025C248E9|nr:hypothetical protein [Caldivirga sp. UBA161]
MIGGLSEVVGVVGGLGPRRWWPWRSRVDPWAVLIAEFLLIQTDAFKVSLTYEGFLRRFPTPCSILEVGQGEVEAMLKPLGLYRQRAERLRRAAEYIRDNYDCRVPCSYSELRGIPGVGDYIAAAVAIVACGESKPILDTNIARVLSRAVLGRNPSRRYMSDKELWMLVRQVKWNKELLYSIIDFASEVCTARNPKCTQCPIKNICKYHTGKVM